MFFQMFCIRCHPSQVLSPKECRGLNQQFNAFPDSFGYLLYFPVVEFRICRLFVDSLTFSVNFLAIYFRLESTWGLASGALFQAQLDQFRVDFTYGSLFAISFLVETDIDHIRFFWLGHFVQALLGSFPKASKQSLTSRVALAIGEDMWTIPC